MKLNTIKAKFIITFSILILTIFLAITIAGHYFISKIITDISAEILRSHLNNAVNEVKTAFISLKSKKTPELSSRIHKAQTEALKKMPDIRIKQSGHVFIFDSQKKILYYPEQEKDPNLSDQPFITDIINNKEGKEISYTHHNERNQCVYAYFQQWDWFICLAISENELYSERSSFLVFSSIMLIVSLVIIVMATLFILRKLVISPLQKILATINSVIIEGDLTRKIDIQTEDEIAEIAFEINLFIQEMNDIIFSFKESSQKITHTANYLFTSIDEVRTGILNIFDSTDEIDQSISKQSKSIKESYIIISQLIMSIENINQRIESQADATDKNLTAINKMTTSINSVDEIAKEASTVSMNLSKVAQEGEHSINDTVRAIKDVEESSLLITDIVEVIRSIAEKTNLLAMNAAIEAAHAEKHGKGFAVVAEEVRKLAESTADSSKEIIALINEISLKIQTGVELANSADQALADIIRDITDNTQLITTISSDMTEQKKAADESLKNISSLKDLAFGIKKSSLEHKTNTDDILKTVNILNEQSAQIINRTENHLDDIKKIAGSMNQITGITQDNKDIVHKLTNMVSFFKVTNSTASSELKHS